MIVVSLFCTSSPVLCHTPQHGGGGSVGGFQTDFVLAPCSPPPHMLPFSLPNWLLAAGLKDNSTLVITYPGVDYSPCPSPRGICILRVWFSEEIIENP